MDLDGPEGSIKKPRVCSQRVSWFGLPFDPLLVSWTDASPLQIVPTLSCSELELHGACVLELHPFLCQIQRATNELGWRAGAEFSRLWTQ